MTRQEIMDAIRLYAELGMCVTKAGILDELDIEDTKENRRELEKELQTLKMDGEVITVQKLEDDGKFSGRGFTTSD